MAHPLHHHRDTDLGLDELVHLAVQLLSTAPAPADRRVQPVPDRRTVRYYQSSGLVDRPSRYEGRQARYGYRHLLQVLAVKLLQRHGQRLATIQRGLAGRTVAELERAVLDGLGLAIGSPSPAPTDLPRQEPAQPGLPAPAAAPRRLVSHALAPGVTLVIDPDVVADPEAVLHTLVSALSGVSS